MVWTAKKSGFHPRKAGLIGCIIAVHLVAFLPSTVVFAQQPTDEAPSAIPKQDELSEAKQREVASLVQAGITAKSRGDLRRALQYFQDAYALFPHPNILIRIARVQDKLNMSPQAIQSYRGYLNIMPSGEDAPEAASRIEALENIEKRQRTSVRIVSEPSGAVVYLEDTTQGPIGYTPTTLPLVAGPHRIILHKEGYKPAERDIEIEAGQAQEIRLELEALPKPKLDTEEENTAWPWIMAGLGTVSTGAAITFFVLSQEEDDQGVETTNETFQTLGYLSAGMAVLGLTGAIVLWTTQAQEDETRKFGTLRDTASQPAIQFEPPSMWFGARGQWGFGLSGQF